MQKSILTNDLKHCFVCGSTAVEIHHVINGTANRKKSDKYGLIIPLCREHHEEVHHYKWEDRGLKRFAQKRFEGEYPNLDFRKVFGKSYL